MAQEPSFPEDAAVGGGSETLDVAASVKQTERAAAEQARKQERGGSRSFITGAAVGVGSAALVAALLYARNYRRGGPDKDQGGSGGGDA
jgi:hypothetical protein